MTCGIRTFIILFTPNNSINTKNQMNDIQIVSCVLKNRTKYNAIQNALLFVLDVAVWTGATDISKKDDWRWTDRFTALGFTDWDNNQPQDNEEHCMVSKCVTVINGAMLISCNIYIVADIWSFFGVTMTSNPSKNQLLK